MASPPHRAAPPLRVAAPRPRVAAAAPRRPSPEWTWTLKLPRFEGRPTRVIFINIKIPKKETKLQILQKYKMWGMELVQITKWRLESLSFSIFESGGSRSLWGGSSFEEAGANSPWTKLPIYFGIQYETQRLTYNSPSWRIEFGQFFVLVLTCNVATPSFLVVYNNNYQPKCLKADGEQWMQIYDSCDHFCLVWANGR